MNHFKEKLKHDSDTKLILQMLQDKDEALIGTEYEYIAISDYDSIATILPELIHAYYKHQIYDIVQMILMQQLVQLTIKLKL